MVSRLDKSAFCWFGSTSDMVLLSQSFPSRRDDESSSVTTLIGSDDSGFVNDMACRLSKRFSIPITISGNLTTHEYETWLIVERTLVELLQL
ncbi:hypothetical protein P9112_002568 [Eukaryota sp. TZLM1-RC]